MNIYDISKKAGVSIATTSRVINNNPNVSEKTKEKVLKVIDESGFTPNAFARGLNLKTMQTIGILCADSSDIYLARAVYFLERELRQQGYNCILCCTGYDLKDKKKCLKLLMSKQTDAIILIGSNFIEDRRIHSQYICDAANQVPVMLLNGYLEAPNIYSILCDDYAATYDAVTKMIRSGKKDILFLYRSLTFSGKQKLNGYLAALKENQIPMNDANIIACQGDIEQVKELLLDLRQKGIVFDGVLASDDELAISVLKYAKSSQVLVPDELAIIGYNNSIIATCCEPELTTIDNKVESLCIAAATTLMSVFEDKNVPSKTVLSATLIQRETTKFNI